MEGLLPDINTTLRGNKGNAILTKGKGKGQILIQRCLHDNWTGAIYNLGIGSGSARANAWCCSIACGHPLPALMDNLTHSAASKHTTAPTSHIRPSPHKHSPDGATLTEVADI